MDTYYIADNKAKQATILQTNKTRPEIWQEIEDRVDVVKKCEDEEHAREYIEAYGNEYVPYDTFIK